MKITITNHNEERQAPEVTIDTKGLTYPYAIRNALDLALELDGYDKSTIDEVFYRNVAVCQDKEEDIEKEDKGFQWYVDRLLEGQYVSPTTKNMFERVKDYFFALYSLNPFEVSAPDVLKLKHEYVNVKTTQEWPSEEELKSKNLDSKFCRGVLILLEGNLPLYVDDTETFDRLTNYFLYRNMAFKEMNREGGMLELLDRYKYLKK